MAYFVAYVVMTYVVMAYVVVACCDCCRYVSNMGVAGLFGRLLLTGLCDIVSAGFMMLVVVAAIPTFAIYRGLIVMADIAMAMC